MFTQIPICLAPTPSNRPRWQSPVATFSGRCDFQACREYLRAGTSFAFNATNILKQTRRRWIDLFADCKARIELVYVEPPFSRILQQNKRREKSVPEEVVRRLAKKFEPPTWTEAHDLIVSDGRVSEC